MTRDVHLTVRPVREDDVPSIKEILDASGLFPSSMLDDMIAPYFQGDSGHRWILVERQDPVGLAYFVPERLTLGCWNLLAIAVHPQAQRQGAGRALLRSVEDELTREGHRLLLIETSSADDQGPARTFYTSNSYENVAVIHDFYQDGEHKVIFRKRLGHPAAPGRTP